MYDGVERRKAHTADVAPGGKVIAFAWTVEVIAVCMGLILAVYAGIEGSDGGSFAIVVAIMPFVALSVIELTKIPLVGLAFRVGSSMWRIVAIVALIFVTLATFENFVFGFERGFNERIRNVERAEQVAHSSKSAQEIAKANIVGLTARQSEIADQLKVLRNEDAETRQQAQQDTADARAPRGPDFRAERERIDRDLVTLDQRRNAEIERERRRCANFPDTRCTIGLIDANYRRQRDDLTRRQRDLMTQEQTRLNKADEDAKGTRQTRDTKLNDNGRIQAALQHDLSGIREQLTEAQIIAMRGAETAAQAARGRE